MNPPPQTISPICVKRKSCSANQILSRWIRCINMCVYLCFCTHLFCARACVRACVRVCVCACVCVCVCVCVFCVSLRHTRSGAKSRRRQIPSKRQKHLILPPAVKYFQKLLGLEVHNFDVPPEIVISGT